MSVRGGASAPPFCAAARLFVQEPVIVQSRRRQSRRQAALGVLQHCPGREFVFGKLCGTHLLPPQNLAFSALIDSMVSVFFLIDASAFLTTDGFRLS